MKKINFLDELTELSLVRNLLLDPEQHGRVPLVQPRDGVVVLDLVGVRLHILVLQMFAQSLKKNIILISCVLVLSVCL